MGAVQVHPARMLHLHYGMPDRVDGTSIGAVTAWARGVGDLDTLERVWRSIDGAKDFQRLRWWWPFGGLYEFSPLARLLRKNIADKPLLTPTYAHLVDLASKAYERAPLHDLTPEQRVEAVIASCSQYGIHTAAMYKGRPCADGGARHSIPWVPEHFDFVHVVSCSPVSTPFEDNHIEPADVSIARGLEVILDGIQAKDYALMCLQASTSKVVLIEPASRYGNPFDASAKTIKHRLEVVGPEAWSRRRWVHPIKREDALRILGAS